MASQRCSGGAGRPDGAGLLPAREREAAATRPAAVGLLFAAAVLWSLGGVVVKSVSWNPMATAGVRSAFAALFLFAAVRRPRFTWSFPQVGGAVAYALTVILFVVANRLTTAANAILLQYTAPIYVAVLGPWFLGERATWLDWATIALVLPGMALFFADKLSAAGVWGSICAALSGVSFACVTLFMRKQRSGSPLESVLLGNVLAALVSIPFVPGKAPGLAEWIVLAFAGVIQLGLPYILYSTALRRVTALEAMLASITEPILNPLWVFLVMGEAPGRWAFIGGSIVLASVTARCAATALPIGGTASACRKG